MEAPQLTPASRTTIQKPLIMRLNCGNTASCPDASAPFLVPHQAFPQVVRVRSQDRDGLRLTTSVPGGAVVASVRMPGGG